MNPKDNILNAQEAANFLGSHVETVRRLARKGEIPAFKMGKDWRFRRSSLLRWIDEHHIRQQRPCVLVVEDEVITREMVKSFLEEKGYRVRLAWDGREGLACLNSEHVNLVLLDLQMPVMNGPEFLSELRQSNKDLPVIILTGYPDSALLKEALRHGPFTLLAKPFQSKTLMQAIHAVSGVAHIPQGRSNVRDESGILSGR